MFPDVVWHVSWSLTGDILAVSGGDNKVRTQEREREREKCVGVLNYFFNFFITPPPPLPTDTPHILRVL